MTRDAIVIGGSYAGLAAALQLARGRRDVLVIDAGRRRNRFAAASHGFLGQDGRPPGAIVDDARAQLRAYPNVAWHDGTVRHAVRGAAAFAVETLDGARHEARRLVLALGMEDVLPDVPGLAERWGRHVFHCPYCHGYELDGGPIGVLATGPHSLHHALLLPDWGPTTFLPNGALALDAEQRGRLAARGVTVDETPVAAIEGAADVRLADGRVLRFAGVFTASRVRPASPLAEELGCAMEEGPLGRFVKVDERKETSVPGVFACGDVARAAGNVSLAVGDGAMAGAGTHQSLIFR